ncbi:hypothetical protein [Micromonospora sp. WMMC250]|uniref:hypothetical protein n=1 Tax=Micromonospora sp. WMMC250 TaxID=3014781 RepID=UPI0022B5F915|nr:hypothetical protein [Micromonospora sp. WMMC250]MCZ7373282.1 hypothetical protein [Micromonospora sp. WMMC250]MCZ7373321.1 hypothetical protein [Micromonospora sp. WMMC250]MCZ7379932.1 hypothetical protein [Micromonospora sp. WMMC250]
MEARSLNRYAAAAAIVLSSAAVMISLVAMVAVTATYTAPSDREQPKITDWMQAWGSIAAVFAGLLAAAAAGAVLRQERKRNEEARLQRIEDRQEAGLAEASAVIYSRLLFDRGGRGLSGVQLDVQNFGQRAVIDLDVVIMLRDGRELVLDRVPVVPPGGVSVKVEDRRLAEDPPIPFALEDGTAKALLHFADLEGTRWKRYGKGKPFRLPRTMGATTGSTT